MTDKSKGQITEDQHYVPQFYLKQWLDETGGFYPIKIEGKIPPRLSVFPQKSDQSRFCYENFFYAQHTGVPDEVSQLIEKKFAEIESVLAKELPLLEEKIIKNEQITESDKHRLAQGMIFLHFRGKKYLDESKKMTDQMTKQMMRHSLPYIGKSPESKAKMEELGLTEEELAKYVNKGEFTVDYGNLHHLQIMDDMEGFCNLLRAKYWKVYISRDGQFITTDAPYLDIPLSDTMWGNDFLSREQSFILSPRVKIIMMYPKNDGGKKIIRKDITGDTLMIQKMNVHSLMNSIRFGFHKDRDLLTNLEETLNVLYKAKQQGQNINW